MPPGLLPAGFRFSQVSLATAAACARRFYLRYLARLPWPADADAAGLAREQGAARGRLFHHLILQQHLGLPVDGEVQAIEDPVLASWWRNLCEHPPSGVPQGRCLAEVELWVPLGPWWLRARFDQVVVDAQGALCIVDWKTGSAPEHGYLESWQTWVYALVASEGGGVFTAGRPVPPDQVSLCYWQAAHPQEVIWYQHSAAAHARAQARIEALVTPLAGFREPDQFGLTSDHGLCRRCEFRAYCGRGEGAGPGWEDEEEEGEEGAIASPVLEPWG